MDSIILLFLLTMGDVIKHSFENLEPFLNIKEQDGIYLYRLIILLKILFVLYRVESIFPESDTWFVFAITNSLIAIKYPSASVLLTAVQCLILPASSKKFALFSSTALFYILSLNIKCSEFLLDLYAVLSLIIYSFEISSHEHQKLRAAISIKIIIVCYLYNLYAYNIKQLSLIVCFLFLTHIPLRPIISNRYKRKALYLHALILIWTAFKFMSGDSHKAQTLTVNFQFYKKDGCYESSIMSHNIEGIKLLQTVRNPIMLNVSETELIPKSLFNNLTCYSKARENICKADDEMDKTTEIMNKSFKLLSIYESNWILKVDTKNFHSMKLKLSHNANEFSNDSKLNLISDVEVLEKKLNSNNLREYFKEDCLTNNITFINRKNTNEKYYSTENKIYFKAQKEDSDNKRSMNNYIGLQKNKPDKIKLYNRRNLSNTKDIKNVGTMLEYNFTHKIKFCMDEKDNFIGKVKEKTRIEDPLQNISRRENKLILVEYDEIQKISKENIMQKFASIESQSIKSAGITYNVTFYERCLYELGKLAKVEKIKQIEQTLINILKIIQRFKANLGKIHKIKEGKHVRERANGNLQDKDSSAKKGTGWTDDEKCKPLNFQVFEKNDKLKSLKSTKDAAKYRDYQKIALILDDDITLQNNLNSIQKKETKNETSIKGISSAKKTEEILKTGKEITANKPIRESKKLLISNNKKGKVWLKNEKKVIKYNESRITKYKKISLIMDEELTLRNISNSIQEKKFKNEASSKGISSSTKTAEIVITSDAKRNAYKPTRESEKK